MNPATACLEGLHLHPSSEPQEGPEPEVTVQDSLAPAEAEEADEHVTVASLGVWAQCISAPCTLCGPHGTGPEGASTPPVDYVAPALRVGGLSDLTWSAPTAENSRTEACQDWEGTEAQGRESVGSNRSQVGQVGYKGGGHLGPITSDVLFPAPEMSAAQNTQPFGLGGDHRTGLTSPEPQNQSRSTAKPATFSSLPAREAAPRQPQNREHSCSFSASAPSPTLPSLPLPPSPTPPQHPDRRSIGAGGGVWALLWLRRLTSLPALHSSLTEPSPCTAPSRRGTSDCFPD